MGETPDSMQIPVNWDVPDDFPSVYASNMLAQAGEYEIVLAFFQTKTPFLMGTPEENKAKLKQLGTIQASCVGKIIINPNLVPKIIRALQMTYDGYIAAQRLVEESNQE